MHFQKKLPDCDWRRAAGKSMEDLTVSAVGARTQADKVFTDCCNWFQPTRLSAIYTTAVCRCEKFVKSEAEKYCTTFHLYVVNICPIMS